MGHAKNRLLADLDDVALAPWGGLDLRINPGLDPVALAAEYQRDGRVRIADFFVAGASDLRDYLEESGEWIQLISTDDGVLEYDIAQRAAISTRRWARIERDKHQRACVGFQYSYGGIRVPGEGECDASDAPLHVFARFMASAPLLDLLAQVTGHNNLHFTDGQATAYGPTDFLTAHDDNVAGKNRVAACVFGMTRIWRLEWGGTLLFHGGDHQSAHGIVPQFNTLDLFKVPQIHSVSMVTPAAPHRRLAVTGWLNQ